MSEEPKITNNQKEKDPQKVKDGKKLGEISKSAKRQKQSISQSLRSASREQSTREEYMTNRLRRGFLEPEKWYSDFTGVCEPSALYVVGSVCAAAAYYYYFYRPVKAPSQPDVKPQDSEEASSRGPVKKNNLIYF